MLCLSVTVLAVVFLNNEHSLTLKSDDTNSLEAEMSLQIPNVLVFVKFVSPGDRGNKIHRANPV